MSTSTPNFANPPIVEAVVDIDCAFAPGFGVSSLMDVARDAFSSQYPKLRKQLLHEFSVAMNPGEPVSGSARQGLQSLHFLQEDELQLVQVRMSGYSFNRLAPYAGFDAYLPEIRRSWDVYRSVASPLMVRAVQLRFINRINLPFGSDGLDLDHYFSNGPRLPGNTELHLSHFLNQYEAIETGTGYTVATVLTAEPPKSGVLPVIFDNAAKANLDTDPADWASIESALQGVRRLKNQVFANTLEKKCLSLFQ